MIFLHALGPRAIPGGRSARAEMTRPRGEFASNDRIFNDRDLYRMKRKEFS